MTSIGSKVLRTVRRSINRKEFESSSLYWEDRYRKGYTSGAGSYGRLAEYKAEILNAFVEMHQVETVLELGCGDGNQLRLAAYPNYYGADVAPAAIARCSRLFESNGLMQFGNLAELAATNLQFDLCLSLDVVYHLVEDPVFEEHMSLLTSRSTKYIAVYSSNFERRDAPHVRHRRFTDWMETNASEFQLKEHLLNQFAQTSVGTMGGSDHAGPKTEAEFFFFERLG